jgi:hypothetical protein
MAMSSIQETLTVATVDSLNRLARENPSVMRDFILAIQQPPKVGSLKLSWRDGKLSGLEFIRQTY